jgi:hypothetical protein
MWKVAWVPRLRKEIRLEEIITWARCHRLRDRRNHCATSYLKMNQVITVSHDIPEKYRTAK